MIINTYKKYILNLFVKSLIEIISIFFALILIINLFEEINFLRDQNVSGFYPVFLALLNAPSIIFDILPFIFLISTLLFFIKLINKSELSIFKYTGITNSQILSIIVVFSFVIGLFLIFGYYTFSSKLKHLHLEIKNSYSSDNKYLAVITENGLWIKDEIDNVINIINADRINKNFLINVSITQFDKKFELIQNITSRKIDVSKNNWVIKNASISKNNITQKNVKNIIFKSHFDIEKINNLFSNLSSLTFWQLKKLKKDYKSLGYSTLDINSHLEKIYAYPIYL